MTSYASFDPSNKDSDVTLSGGNLTAATTGGAAGGVASTALLKSTGTYYYELLVNSGVANAGIGIAKSTYNPSGSTLGDVADGYAIYSNGNIRNNGNNLVVTGVTFVDGDRISVLFDGAAGKIEFYKNGVSMGSYTGLAATSYRPAVHLSGTANVTANFGGSAFTYTPPGGYVGWDDANPTVDVSAPRPVISARLGNDSIVLTAPRPILSAAFAFNVLSGAAPLPILVSTAVQSPYTTANVVAPVPALSITVLTGQNMRFIGVAPAPSLDVSAMIGEVISADLRAPVPNIVSAVTNPTVIRFGLTAPVARLSIGVATGEIITAALRAPAPTVMMFGYPVGVISAVLLAPAPRLDAALTTAILAVYRTWVLNTRKSALSEYGPEFAFNSFANFNGKVLACSPNGLVVLGLQDLDNATKITSRIRMGQESFESSFNKRVPRIYVSGSFTGDMLFRTITTEGGTRTYALPFNGVTGIQQRRVPVGKGPKSRLWQFEIENVDGADFGLNDMLIYPTKLRRRVQ